jgi:hypothetical protein
MVFVFLLRCDDDVDILVRICTCGVEICNYLCTDVYFTILVYTVVRRLCNVKVYVIQPGMFVTTQHIIIS